MPCTAKDLVALARSYLGTSENPLGSNNVIFNTHYYNQQVSGDNYAWCVTAVWDWFRMAGASDLFFRGKKTAYCPAVQMWGKQDKLTVPVSDAREGDLVLYDWNGNKSAQHIGVCLENHESTITTIEGNCNNRVEIQTRKHTSVVMVIRPAYTVQPSSCDQCPILEALRTLYNKLKEESIT